MTAQHALHWSGLPLIPQQQQAQIMLRVTPHSYTFMMTAAAEQVCLRERENSLVMRERKRDRGSVMRVIEPASMVCCILGRK